MSGIRKKIVKFRLMQKNYKEALDIYNKCLEIDVKHYGENHGEVAKLYEAIGGV